VQIARLVLGPPQNQGKPDKCDGNGGDCKNAFEWHDDLLVKGKTWPRPGIASLIEIKLVKKVIGG
jgi:hypothetical protein